MSRIIHVKVGRRLYVTKKFIDQFSTAMFRGTPGIYFLFYLTVILKILLKVVFAENLLGWIWILRKIRLIRCENFKNENMMIYAIYTS